MSHLREIGKPIVIANGGPSRPMLHNMTIHFDETVTVYGTIVTS
ncbi:hypothetical protein [Novipirellula herctigrandis]